jgi:hypothetical protein
MDPTTLIREAVAATRKALPAWDREHDKVHRTGRERRMRAWCGCFAPHKAIEAAEAWLACPCADHAKLAERRGVEVGPRERWVTSIGHAIGALQNGLADVAADYAREAIRCSAEVVS